MHHFVAICELKLELQSGNAQIGAFFFTSVTLTFDLWSWPFAWTSPLSMVITPENFMMMRWEEQSEKGVIGGQMEGRTEPFLKLLGRSVKPFDNWEIHYGRMAYIVTDPDPNPTPAFERYESHYDLSRLLAALSSRHNSPALLRASVMPWKSRFLPLIWMRGEIGRRCWVKGFEDFLFCLGFC